MQRRTIVVAAEAAGASRRSSAAPCCRPFSAGRNPSLPDDNELIVVRTGALEH